MTVDTNEAARRIYESKKKEDNRGDEPDYKSADDAEKTIRHRVEVTKKQFQDLYGVDFMDPANYDATIDTSGQASGHETVEKILKAIKERDLNP